MLELTFFHYKFLETDANNSPIRPVFSQNHPHTKINIPLNKENTPYNFCI